MHWPDIAAPVGASSIPLSLDRALEVAWLGRRRRYAQQVAKERASATSGGATGNRRNRLAQGRSIRPHEGHGLPITTGDGVFRPLKTAEAFARDLVRDIVDQGLRTGDKLPSEAVMLEEYKLSRESLREGLRLLEVQGLITIRRGPGGGPIVGHLDPASLGRTSTLYFHLAGATYRELLEAWVVLEPILAERAARNPDRELVRATMEPYAHIPDEHDDEAIDAFVAAHIHFHRDLAALAENRVLELHLQTIGQIVTHHIIGHADPRQVREMIEADHVAIAKAISAGSPQRAAKAMEQHIGSLVAQYEADLGRQLDDYIDWR
jgi:DNA-binding FadR family transcriptional regulator